MTEKEYLLTCLMEEAAEIQQAASKALRFGVGSNFCPETECTYDNGMAITREMIDLTAVAEMLAQRGILRNLPEFDELLIQKQRKVEYFMRKHLSEARE